MTLAEQLIDQYLGEVGDISKMLDKLGKFSNTKIKPGRNTIKGFPVDIKDYPDLPLFMKAVDKDATTGLVKELRKAGFKAKADKKGGITIR